MKLSEIAVALRCQAGIAKDVTIETLLTDSRQLVGEPSTTLFFALRSERADGADYIGALYEKGVRSFVVHGDKRIGECYPDASFLFVDDTLAALQDLAAYKRSLNPDLEVIGITGSNGKTVVKEWLYELLKDDYTIIRSPKSYNSQIGVPLSVWLLPDPRELTSSTKPMLAIFEAGISRKGEMAKLEKMIRPTLGVVTYIGHEHDENFSSLEEKRAEKMLLFSHARQVVEDPSHQNARTCRLVMQALGYEEDVIQERLLKKTHETVMQVNLSALADNVRYFKGLLRPSTQLTCMVKAFAYGVGSVEVAQCLEQHGADNLAVAVCDEGVELRRAGVRLPIIIMDPEVSALETILENNLEPNIYSFQSLNNIIEVARKQGMERYPIHIKIDSGMHRLGFDKEDMPRLADMLRDERSVEVRTVFSHLCVADEPQWDAFTHEQIALFDYCAEYLKSALPYPIMKHILNSAGMERFTDYQFDMCRLGIGLYGFSFVGAKLRNVCTLKSTILSVKTIKAGESIGYGRHTWLQENRQIAVLPIGYADGFDRRLGNGAGEVLVRGKRCPTMGNVCMDLLMVDVTGTDAQPGDEAIIFGDKLPLEEMAQKLGTITYEILTSVSRRVKRVYAYDN